MVRFLDLLARAFAGFGWALTPPAGPYDFGFAVPVPCGPEADPLEVPLSAGEREAFARIVAASGRGRS